MYKENSHLVTIIIPTFNRAKFLEKSIISALLQTYKNTEIIVWNDGSQDETERIVRSFKNKKIKYFYHKNRGMSYSLNNAIKKSKGEYIAFLDDDDQWTNDKIYYQVSLLRKHNLDMIFSNYKNINIEKKENGIGFEQCRYSLDVLKKTRIEKDVYLITSHFLNSIAISNYIAFDTVLIKRKIINEVGKFNENLRNSMDFEYWWRLGLNERRIAFTNKILMTRIKPKGSLSSPSIITYKNKIMALESCMNESRKAGRKNIIKKLDNSHRNALINLATLYRSKKDYKLMIKTYIISLKYGMIVNTIGIVLNNLKKYLF